MRCPAASALAHAPKTVTVLLLALLSLGATLLPASSAHAGGEPAATRSLDAPPNPWQLADDIGARVEGRWSTRRGLYLNEHGFPDTRLNALLLQLHSMAALAGHVGPIRHDDRIAPIVAVLTQPPVLVTRSLRPREVGHIPHAPAWTPAIGEDPEQAVLHPSIDTGVVRALTAAWRARFAIAMNSDLSARIGQVLVDLAHSSYYRGNSRTLNQINWPTEVYSAALEVTGDTSVLAFYREQLMWFADHAHRAAERNGSPNLTSGGGFRYLPNRSRSAQLNRIETIEYGNLALSSLGMYRAALAAGMTPLPRRELQTLEGWSRHMLLGSWTHTGYPNWDTGLGTHRRHLRQYWAWSLDSLMTASGHNALLGYPKQRGYARSIAERGIALYLRMAWSPSMRDPAVPLPAKTSFDAPNGFSSGSGNELISPLRFAVLSASLDGRFQDVPAATPPNWMAHDRETGRFAFSTPRYNGAIVPSRGGQGQGGIEPVRLYDGAMRPLTALGGRGAATLGLAVTSGGRTILDTEPAAPSRQSTGDVRLLGKPADTAASFGRAVEATATAAAPGARVALRHRLTATGIDTSYRLSRLSKGAQVALRIPVWGQDGTLEVVSGAVRRSGQWMRTRSTLTLRAKTAAGGSYLVRLRGLPKQLRITTATLAKDGYQPGGGQRLTVSFTAPSAKVLRLTRSVLVAPAR